MSEKHTLIDLLNAMLGGAGTTLFGALIGRAMWHTTEVRRNRRKALGPELLWEVPVVFGMAVIGESAAAWMGYDSHIATGLVAVLAYFGPRGTEALFMRWFGERLGKGEGGNSPPAGQE
jgi:hypothetical protein